MATWKKASGRGYRPIAVIIAAIAVWGTAGVDTASAESTYDIIKKTGVFIAGVRPDSPPFGSVDNSGNPVGFGPALAKIIADRMGVQLKLTTITSTSRVPLLQGGNIHADIGVTTPTKQRLDVMDFTTPYLWDNMVLLVRKGASRDVKDYGAPKKLSVTQGGAAAMAYTKEALPTAEFVQFQEVTDSAAALLTRKVDAMVANGFQAMAIAKQHPDQVEVGNVYARDPIAIGLRLDDSKWRNFLDVTLQELWHEGKYQALFEEYFGMKPDWQIWSAYRLQPGIGTK